MRWTTVTLCLLSLGCGDGGSDGGSAVTPPPPPPKSISVTCTPSTSNVLQGTTYTVTAVATAQNGATIAGVSVTVNGTAVGSGAGPSYTTPAIPTPTAGTHSVSCTATSPDATVTAGAASVSVVAPITLVLARKDAISGRALTAPWSISIGGQGYTSDGAGKVSVSLAPGRYTVGRPVNATDAYDFAKWQLDPVQFKGDDSVRVLFPRFPTDTVTFASSGSFTLLQLAADNPDFDLGHFQAEFDEALYGMQGIGPGNVRFLFTNPAAGVTVFPAMDPALRALFQTNVVDWTKQKASDMYTVTHGDTTSNAPLTPVSSSVYLVQLPSGGGSNGLYRGSRGQVIGASAGVNYNPIFDVRNAVVSEGLTSIYGANAEEDQICRKPSIFNDPLGTRVPRTCIDLTYYPAPTATDNVEGLQMLRHFANQAKKRALIEAQKLPANAIPFYFSTRAASQASLVGPAVPAGATLVPHGIQLRESPAGWHRRAARTEP